MWTPCKKQYPMEDGWYIISVKHSFTDFKSSDHPTTIRKYVTVAYYSNNSIEHEWMFKPNFIGYSRAEDTTISINMYNDVKTVNPFSEENIEVEAWQNMPDVYKD